MLLLLLLLCLEWTATHPFTCFSPISKWPVCADGDVQNSPLCSNYSSYLLKRKHVNLACRLTQAEEKIIMFMLEDKEIREIEKCGDLASRRNLMNCVDKGETKSNHAKFNVLYSPQRDGGFAFQSNLLEVEKKQLLQRFAKNGMHWISCCAIKDDSFNATYEGKKCIAFIDSLWDMKLTDGFFSVATAMMSGNVSLQISSSSTTKLYQNTQYFCQMLTRWVLKRDQGRFLGVFCCGHCSSSYGCFFILFLIVLYF